MDFSASVCDAQGRTVSQAVTVPFHLGSVPAAMETLLAHYGGQMQPGDVFLMNDPFDGGIHLQDIFVFRPIFLDTTLIGFATTTAHHGDVGGRLPGSAACDNTEIFQEGIRLPWLRLYDEGEPVDPDRPGIARELARMNLSLNFYTQWYWKTDLHNLMHFLRLRVDAHAQWEIRAYGERINEIVERWVPMTHGAFKNYRLGGAALSEQALLAVRRMLAFAPLGRSAAVPHGR